MTSKQILWVDNDPGNLESLVKALQARGHAITTCTTVSIGERVLHEHRFDLVILDVMMPVTEAELAAYPYAETNDTMSTGLVFYKRMRAKLAPAPGGAPVLVMTVRIDRAIAEEFASAGLPAKSFATRYELRDTRQFVARVETMMGITNA